jgi:twitching motility protein PilT
VQDFNLDRLLKFAIDKQASDVHLRSGRRPLVRIRGGLVPLNMEPLPLDLMKTIAHNMMTDQQLDHYKSAKAVDLGYAPEGVNARFRVSIYHQKGTPAIAMRYISNELPSVGSLGLPQAIKVVCNRAQGMVLVTGPTGAGKSTTLATLINEINFNRPVHIITIEDPIEYMFEDQRATISQIEVGIDTPSFNTALKHALRQDPDVIMIGEMRDRETIEIALTAAETGHLIFSTLHTNSAYQSINRIIDAFAAEQHNQIRLQLSQALLAIFSQKLVNRGDQDGRIASMEIMFASPGVKELIRKGEINMIHDLIARSVEYYRMQTMDQSLIALIANQVIRIQDGLSTSSNPEELQLSLNKMGLDYIE